MGSVCYLIKSTTLSQSLNDSMKDCLFTGDTLFLCGCGRFFEGTPEQMLMAMDKIASLSNETLIYPGHEYTLQNMKVGLFET